MPVIESLRVTGWWVIQAEWATPTVGDVGHGDVPDTSAAGVDLGQADLCSATRQYRRSHTSQVAPAQLQPPGRGGRSLWDVCRNRCGRVGTGWTNGTKTEWDRLVGRFLRSWRCRHDGSTWAKCGRAARGAFQSGPQAGYQLAWPPGAPRGRHQGTLTVTSQLMQRIDS